MIFDGVLFARRPRRGGWVPGPHTRSAWRWPAAVAIVYPLGACLWCGLMWPALDGWIEALRAHLTAW